MTKRIKKMPVRPEMRRLWLQRFEEEGESITHIAKADKYDARTVRRQLEIERQNRERKETRTMVLRHALEQHYADLCAFAEKLDSHLNGEEGSLSVLKQERLFSALHEHLPRSVIWKKLDRWEYVQGEIKRLKNEMKEAFKDLIKSRSPLGFMVSRGEIGLSEEGLVSAFLFHCEKIARGQQGLFSIADFELNHHDERVTYIQLGAFYVGRVPNEQVSAVQKMVRKSTDEITKWQSYYDLEKLYFELAQLQETLKDELAVITFKRVVPGQCRYCPI